MVKKILVLLILSSVNLFAIDFDARVGFTGSQSPSGEFYKQLPKMPDSTKLMLGFSSIVPGRKTEELDVDLKLGVLSMLPIIGEATVYFTFNNHGGVVREGYKNSDFYTQSLSLSKSWLYPLTERVDIGMTAVLGQALLNGEYHITVLPAVYPILSMTINLF